MGFERPKINNDVIVKEGELRRMRDPRTGRIKEVDMSLTALSRTMEQIRKSAEIINRPAVSLDTVMNRFKYIEELVLDHAQFSPKLRNLQIRIMDKTIEVVSHIEDLEICRQTYARNYFFTRAKAELAKENRSSKEARKGAIEKAMGIITSGLKYLKDDKEVIEYLDKLTEEKNSL